MALGNKKIARWYLQLGQNLEAGLPLPAALRASAGAPPASVDRLASALELGASVDTAIDAADSWLPQADRAFLITAAQTGRLPHTLRNLADRREQLGATTTRVLLAFLYPAGVLHLGFLVVSILRRIDFEHGLRWDTIAFLTDLAWFILPLWTAVLVIVVLARRENPVLARIVGLMPALGGYKREQALSDFSFALGNSLEAGAPIGAAWETAARSSRSPALLKAAADIGATIARGEQPGLRLARHACFPQDFVSLYRTGEVSGQLETNLLRLAGQFQERANTRLNVAAIIYPAAIFMVVAAFVAYVVISFYAGYLNTLLNMAEP